MDCCTTEILSPLRVCILIIVVLFSIGEALKSGCIYVSAENLPLKCCSYTQLHDVEFPLRDTNSSFQARLAKDDVD